MSECPNCGSADYHMPHGEQCRINEAVRERDVLIRSLREERDQLQEGLQDAHRQLHRIGQRERDAERDQIADWLLLEGNELAVSYESVSPSTAVHRTWSKIRNNEHRSNG